MRPAALALALALCAQACSRSDPGEQPAPAGPRIAGLPVQLTLAQRSTTEVPGSEGAVRVTVDDITRGQVGVTLLAADGTALLAPTSLAPTASATFLLAGREHQIRLERLENALVGQDFATLTISAGSGRAEAEKIEQLLETVSALAGATFVRNGSEHSPAAAAAHLRRKWQSAASSVATAAEFVLRVASESSVTREPYIVRHADGTTEPLRELLERRLRELESGTSRPEAAPPATSPSR